MNEAEFKAAKIAQWKKLGQYKKIFCIESEETVPGFPDVMASPDGNMYWDFFEFKASDTRGVITFKKSQPAFYNKHSSMHINILAWDNKEGVEHLFLAQSMFDPDSQYTLDSRRQVRLPKKV